MQVDMNPVPWWFDAVGHAFSEERRAEVGALVDAMESPYSCVAALRFAGVVDPSRSIRLSQQLLKAFAGGEMPTVTKTSHSFCVFHREEELMENMAGGFRFEGADFVQFGGPATFWPPPLDSGERCSATWEFDCEGFRQDRVDEFFESLDVTNGGVFRALKDGRPLPDRYTLRVPGAWREPKDFEASGMKFTYVPRCGLCWRSAEPHEAMNCPLLVTMNKMRVKEGYQTVLVSQSGEVSISNAKVKVDLEKEVEALRTSIKLLVSRIEKLEGGAKIAGGSKRRVEEPTERPQNSKKAKAEEKGKAKDKGKVKKSSRAT